MQQGISYQPLDCIVHDILGPMNLTENGNHYLQYIFVFSDYYTKCIEAFALKDHLAVTVADKLITECVCRSSVLFIIQTKVRKLSLSFPENCATWFG